MATVSETRLRHAIPSAKKAAIDTGEAVVEAVKKVSHTLHWDELPEWARDNEYIVTGYRR